MSSRRISTDGTLVIEISGSGDIELAGIDAERVEAVISGSGGIDLAGTTTELLVKLDGSGDIDASDLSAQEAIVEIGGSGDVSVAARDNLAGAHLRQRHGRVLGRSGRR